MIVGDSWVTVGDSSTVHGGGSLTLGTSRRDTHNNSHDTDNTNHNDNANGNESDKDKATGFQHVWMDWTNVLFCHSVVVVNRTLRAANCYNGKLLSV